MTKSLKTKSLMIKLMSAALVAVACAALAGPAEAGIWAWGCRGTLKNPTQQVIFNRSALVVIDGDKTPVDLRDLLGDKAVADLVADEVISYEPDDYNDGLSKRLEFTHDGSPKITLTEVSSKRLTHRKKLVCGRDDITDTFRKVYRFMRGDEKPRVLTMQCIEYVLTTRGGRKGCE